MVVVFGQGSELPEADALSEELDLLARVAVVDLSADPDQLGPLLARLVRSLEKSSCVC